MKIYWKVFGDGITDSAQRFVDIPDEDLAELISVKRKQRIDEAVLGALMAFEVTGFTWSHVPYPEGYDNGNS